MRRRDPVSVQSLDDALYWLCINTNVDDWLYQPVEEWPDVVRFACDMFWVRPTDLCDKLRRIWEGCIEIPKPVLGRRSRRSHGWL